MANRYWVGGNANWDATAGTKWALTSGGTGGEAVPTSSDAVYLDNGTGTGSVTVTAAAACASLDCTGYVNTLAVGTQTISVSGSVTLAAGMTITGTTGYLSCIASGTLTANGKTWPARLQFGGTAQTYTLADAWSVTGLLSTIGSTSATINGSTLSVAGGTQFNNTLTTGTTALTITGGTWACQGWLELNTTIAGDITLGSGTNEMSFKKGTLTYSSGTITQGTNDLNIQGYTSGAPTVLNTSGVTWYRVVVSGGGATGYISLSSTLNATTLAISGTSSPTFVGAAGFTVGTLTNSSTLDSGRTITLQQERTYTVTSAFTLAGTASFSWTIASSSGSLRVPLTMSGSSPTLSYVNATRVDSSGGNPIYTNGTITDSLNWSEGAAGGLMWLS